MDTPPRIVAIDDDLVVVDKPSGLAVHPGQPDQPHLVGWLDAHPDVMAGVVPVHRLDVGTSGLVLCAADPATRQALSAALEQGAVRKTYRALVYGHTRRKGMVRRPLRVGDGPAKPAVTRYRSLEQFSGTTYLEVRPQTGRKHQIRRHLHGLRHPIVGDERYRYGRRTVPAFPGRLWLHALRIELPDGRSFTAELPDALEQHLEVLRTP